MKTLYKDSETHIYKVKNYAYVECKTCDNFDVDLSCEEMLLEIITFNVKSNIKLIKKDNLEYYKINNMLYKLEYYDDTKKVKKAKLKKIKKSEV